MPCQVKLLEDDEGKEDYLQEKYFLLEFMHEIMLELPDCCTTQ